MKWLVFIFTIAFYFLSKTTVQAAQSVSFNGYLPTQVVMGQPFDVPVKLASCVNCGDSFFRIVFFATDDEGSGGYFGATLNNSAQWADRNSGHSSFYSVLSSQLIDNSWSATMSAKVDALGSYAGPDVGPNAISGNSYKIKVIRYTSGGDVAAESASQQITILDSNYATPTPTPSPTVSPTSTPTPTPIPQPGNVFLNEYGACPSSGAEWVELYNANDTPVTLTDWKIKDDKDNPSNINGQIGAKSYGVFDVSNLNNDVDTVRLYNGTGNPVDYHHYDSCYPTYSWSKKSDGTWQQTLLITKGSANRFPTPIPSPSITPSPSPSSTPTIEPEVLGESTESGIPTLVVSQETAENLASKSGDKKKESPVFAILAIVLGLISLLTLGGYLWYDWRKKQSAGVIS